ncbi:MAG: hypothetical protein V4636_03075 [Pseudomonadota bacterium]
MKPMKPMEPMDPLTSSESQWWPQGLSKPSSTGSQGTLRYAFFPADRRLVVDRDGDIRQYDTGDHLINGISQTGQGNGVMGEARFTSQHGDIDLTSLRPIQS